LPQFRDSSYITVAMQKLNFVKWMLGLAILNNNNTERKEKKRKDKKRKEGINDT
jgi:hypothetical protein